MTRSVFHTLFALLVLLATAAAVVLLITTKPEPREQAPADAAMLIETRAAERQEVRVPVIGTGTLEPRHRLQLSSEVGGRVVAVHPQLVAGGRVAAGEVLLQVDERDRRAALAQARQVLAQAELAVAQERAQAAQARREWEAMGPADAQAGPLVLRQPQIAQAEARLAAAAAQVAQAEDLLQRSSVPAPFAALVLSGSVEPGQVITMGAPVAELAGTAVGEVTIPLTDAQWRLLGEAPGAITADQLTVTIRSAGAADSAQRPARLVRIHGQRDPRTRMLAVVVAVDEPLASDAGAPLPFGTYCEATFRGPPLREIIEVPPVALHGEQVAVVEGDRLRLVPVTVVHQDRDRVLLRSAELEPADRICISPVDLGIRDLRVRTAAEATP